MSKYILALALLISSVFVAVVSEGVAPLIPFVHPTATVVFGGDMMFDRAVRVSARERGEDYLFSCVDPLFETAHLVNANLEGPITSHGSVSEGSVVGSPQNFTFTFPTTTAELLSHHNVLLVNLGNNHTLNFGSEGLMQTQHYLRNAGVMHFGDPDKREELRVARLTVREIPLSFVSWSDWTSDKTDHTVAQVAKEKGTGRVVIVYAHWGEEYIPVPQRTRMLARQFVDAGAALVVGSHSHVVGEHEEYKGKHIYYSLGNFIFDQHFRPDVETGLLLRVTLNKKGVHTIEEIPIHINKTHQPCPVPLL